MKAKATPREPAKLLHSGSVVGNGFGFRGLGFWGLGVFRVSGLRVQGPLDSHQHRTPNTCRS